MQRSIENLGILNKLMRLSLSEEPLPQILEKSLDIIHQTSWLRILPKGGIFLTDGDKLVLTASRHLSEELHTLCSRISFGYCLCGRAALTKSIQFASCVDHRHDVSFAGMPPHGHYNAPILDENKHVLGVLVLYLVHGHKKDDSELEFLETVADTLASVIKRKQAEECNERLVRIIDGAANEIYVIDAATKKFIQANHIAQRNLGYSEEELLQLTPETIVPEFTSHDMEKLFSRLQNGENNHIQFETIHRRKDGTDYFVSVKLQIIQFENNTTYAVIAEDITSRKKAERELGRYRDELELLVMERTQQFEDKAQELEKALNREKAINEQQRQFVSMASHEFRTPLAIIDSSAQHLSRKRDRMTANEVDKRVDKIRSAVARMTQLMESTLSAAQSDTGKIKITPKEGCDLISLLNESGKRFQEVSRSHKIIYDLDGLPKTIKGDQAILDQVFTNLLSNAIKYSPNSDEILITGEIEGDAVQINIRDYGLGIDQEDLPRMFGRFFRAKTSIGIAGTGIGLNLVKMFVEAHGGSVSLVSRKGEGSCFTVHLPYRPPALMIDRKADAA